LTISDGNVIRVEGGGKMNDHLRQVFEEFKNEHFPSLPDPGGDWSEYAVWAVNLSIAPVSNAHELAWTGKFWGELIDRRAGIVCVPVGITVAGLT
jgi:hypothetical protein